MNVKFSHIGVVGSRLRMCADYGSGKLTHYGTFLSSMCCTIIRTNIWHIFLLFVMKNCNGHGRVWMFSLVFDTSAWHDAVLTTLLQEEAWYDAIPSTRRKKTYFFPLLHAPVHVENVRRISTKMAEVPRIFTNLRVTKFVVGLWGVRSRSPFFVLVKTLEHVLDVRSRYGQNLLAYFTQFLLHVIIGCTILIYTHAFWMAIGESKLCPRRAHYLSDPAGTWAVTDRHL